MIDESLVAGADPLSVEDALASLRRLARVRRQGDSIALHRLVGNMDSPGSTRPSLIPGSALTGGGSAASMFVPRDGPAC